MGALQCAVLSITHSGAPLDRVRAALPGTDADRLVDRRDKNLAVADPTGMRSLLDRFDRAFDQALLHHDFDLHLWQKVDHVFGSAVEFGMSLLSPETLGLGDGDTFDADLVKRFLHLVELKWLDDRLDLFHRILISLNPRQWPRGSLQHNPCHAVPRQEMAPFTHSLPNFCSSDSLRGWQIAEKLADPLDGSGNCFAAVGVREAQIAFAELAKARP